MRGIARTGIGIRPREMGTETFLVRKRRLIAVVIFLAATFGFVELFGIRESFNLD